jgi:hypothetical protein
MKRIRFLPVIITGLLFAAALSAVADPQAPAGQPAPPTKEIDEQLAPTTKIDAYEFRPPKGFTLKRGDGPLGVNFTWSGPERADKSHAYLRISFDDTTFSSDINDTPPAVVVKVLLKEPSHYSQYKASGVEQVRLGSLTVYCGSWSGFNDETKKWTAAFFLAGDDGRTRVYMDSRDSEPYTSSQALMAASAMTFRKSAAQ